MKVIDCTWELDNIGKRVQEIDIEEQDTFQSSPIPHFDESFDMVVIKCPINKIEFNIEIAKRGAFLVETQIEISKTYKSFDFEDRFVKSFQRNVEFEDVVDSEGLNSVLEKITPSMFTTDRVSLDPSLGPEHGANRYKSWIKSSLSSGQSSLIKVLYKNTHVGFALYRINNGVWDAMLGGLYASDIYPGLGLLTPSAPLLYAKQRNLEIVSMTTAISSNNLPVLRLYSYMGFNVTAMKYVFVKHLR